MDRENWKTIGVNVFDSDLQKEYETHPTQAALGPQSCQPPATPGSRSEVALGTKGYHMFYFAQGLTHSSTESPTIWHPFSPVQTRMSGHPCILLGHLLGEGVQR